MKVLVTGATGFIGSAIVRHLLAANYEVRILARTKRNQFLLSGLDVDIVDGNVTSPSAVEAAMKGCSVVIDVASVYAFYPFWEKHARAMYRINVQGTKNMLEAAYKNRVKRYVHTSTIATIGKNEDGKPSTENTPFDSRNASHYARSKYLAEQEVTQYCQKGLSAIILNPAIVIGQRDHKPTPSGEIIVKFLNRNYPGYFDATWSVADVDDVARAHVSAITKGTSGERYILCNKQPCTMKGMFQSLEKVSNIKAPKIKFPFALLNVFIHVEEFLAYKLFKRKPLLPTEGVKFCRNSIHYDNSKAVSDLGYRETPFNETLKKAVHWYRRNSYIEPRGLFRSKARGSKLIKQMMRFLKIDQYTDRFRPDTVVFYLIVKFLCLLQKVGFKSKKDGWRRITQSYLNTEQSKFVLASFRLDFFSDHPGRKSRTLSTARTQMIKRLSEFFRDQPSTHWQLKYHTFSVEGIKKTSVDIVYAEFDSKGQLRTLEPYFDPADRKDIDSITPKLRAAIHKGIIKSYNNTKDVSDFKRPKLLKQELGRWLSYEAVGSDHTLTGQMRHYVERILSAMFIHFEETSSSAGDFGVQRYKTPSFIKRKHPGFGFLNILCRFDRDFKEADLWVQFSHVPADGVPMQEVLKSLKKQWGQVEPFKLPSMNGENSNVAGIPALCSSNGGAKGIYHVNAFVDFHPFLKYRKQFIAQYEGKFKNNITIAALLLWELAHYSAFEDMKFAVPIDLAETSRRERSLGFAFIRPGIYFDKNKADRGFLNFQRDFDRYLRATKKRKSIGYRLLESYALTSPFMYRSSIKLIPSAIGEFAGTIGLTIIKNAELFLSPYTDVHVDGFIAISNFHNRAQDGSKVCNVSIKGPKNRVSHYMEAIKEVASLKI